MPNWVRTRITFPDVTDEQFCSIVCAYCGYKGGNGQPTLDFEKILPIPDDVLRGDLSFDEIINHTSGKENWYDWCIKNWGTKWNAFRGTVDPDCHALYFETAWDYPYPVINKLASQLGTTIVAVSLDEDVSRGVTITTHYTTRCAMPRVVVATVAYDSPGFWDYVQELWGMTKEDYLE